MRSKGEICHVLYVAHSGEFDGGASWSLINLIDGLCGTVSVSVIVPIEGAITRELAKRNIQYYVTPFLSEFYYSQYGVPSFWGGVIKCGFNFLLALRLSFVLKREGIDIIHSNSSVIFFGAYLAFLMKKKHVWHFREFGWDDYRIKYYFGIPYLNFWLKKATSAICVSNSIWEARVKKLRFGRKDVISNGVVVEGQIGRGIKRSDCFVFAIVGLLSETKNQLEALEAFSLLYQSEQNIKLFVIGSGNTAYQQQLLDYIRDNKLSDSVKLMGHQSSLALYYQEADVLLMCSPNEAFGRVTVEAMANGCVVIGRNSAGTSEIIEDGYTGLLYSNGAAELAGKMELLMYNPALLKKISEVAMEEVKRLYTVDFYCQNVRRVYCEIM